MIKETKFNLSEKKFPRETWEDRARESKTLENKRIANKEFNLSEKMHENQYWKGCENGELDLIESKDIREFIKIYPERLRKLSVKINNEPEIIGVDLAILELRNLAGEKLIGSEEKK